MTSFPTLDAGGSGAVDWNRPADQLRAKAESTYDRIRSRPELNDEARTALLAQAYQKAVSDMASLEDRTGAQSLADVGAIKRRLFGVDDLVARGTAADAATIAISFRDAQDRASQVTSDAEALALLQTANDTGDELLARAIGNRALSDPFGSDSVADAYLADRPTKAAALEELNAASKPISVSLMWEFVVPKPPELAAMNEAAIAVLADGASRFTS